MVTLEEIARRAGVSRNTVASALSGRTKGKWARTAVRVRRIREIAASLGYRPNTAAKATATGSFGSVGFIQRSSSNLMPFELIRGVSEELAANDLRMTFARLSAESVADETYAPRLLREFCVDGLLVNESLDIPEAVASMISRHRIPAVWMNAKNRYDAVYPDEIAAFEDATAQLITLGHRRIAYVNYYTDWGTGAHHFSSVDRLEGYRRAMTAAGLIPRVVEHGYEAITLQVNPEAHLADTRHALEPPWRVAPWGTPTDDRLARLVVLLRSRDRPTAILAGGWSTVAVTVQAAAAAGLDAPRELSLLAVNESPIDVFSFPVSTLQLPMRQVGWAAVQMLLRKLGENCGRIGSVSVGYSPPTPGSLLPPP